jgi:hypothetical protein
MPDITMCANMHCPLKTLCYRNAASGTQASNYQSMALFKPKSETECDNFYKRGD